MEVAVDLEKVDNLLRLLAHVAYRRRCGRVRQIRVEQQIHLERSEISVDELKQRRSETGDRLRGEVVVFRQRVVFRVEDHVEDLAGEQVLDLSFRQSHCLSPEDEVSTPCGSGWVQNACKANVAHRTTRYPRWYDPVQVQILTLESKPCPIKTFPCALLLRLLFGLTV